MELHIRNSFFRDWDNINSRALNSEIEIITHKVKKANAVAEVHRMKKLIGYTDKYKIELRVHTKIYWILCQRFGNRIDFYRIIPIQHYNHTILRHCEERSNLSISMRLLRSDRNDGLVYFKSRNGIISILSYRFTVSYFDYSILDYFEN